MLGNFRESQATRNEFLNLARGSSLPGFGG